jgi:ATP-dependent Clp protease ATP-binding subunit ClpC
VALDEVTVQKDEAIAGQDYEGAARLRDDEAKGKERVEQLKAAWHEERNKETPVVTDEDIAHVVSMWTGIPVIKLSIEESERLLHMEEALHKRYIGQEEGITTISRAVRRARAGLKDPKRPIGSFIFSGPTGVGKTELARALAEFMFGSEDALIKIDMSEFMERHNVSRLVGAPPGYVGYDEGGQLTEAVRRKGYSVVLLDEIEKAHPEVFNILLQILEDGHLTDAKGRRVDFRNTVIIMTSNVGAQQMQRDTSIGFRASGATESAQAAIDYERMKDKVLGELKSTFRPEFLNRIDATVVFRQLTREEIRAIVDLLLVRVKDQLAGQEMDLQVTDAAKDSIIEKGYDQAFGARPLRREIQNQIEDPLSERMLEASFEAGDTVVIDVGPDGTLSIERVAPPTKRQPAKAAR